MRCSAFSERGAARTILGLTTFGIAIEMLRPLSPGQSPDLLDLVVDFVGAGLGCGAAIMPRRMTSLLIDKDTAGATPCRARVAGGDVQSASGNPGRGTVFTR